MENKSNKNFCEVVQDQNLWCLYAGRLKEAYKLLEKNNWISQRGPTRDVNHGGNDYTTTIMMLKGMTLECLFKGILVNQGIITCRNEELEIPKKYLKHSLVSMANDVRAFVYTDKEKDVLERLEYYIVAGRLPRRKINTGKFKGYWMDNDDSVYSDVLKRIEEIYSDIQKTSNR